MKQNKFPPGWDEERVQSVIDYYENQTEDEAVAEAEAGLQNESVTLMEIPTELVPVVLELISKHSADNLTTDRNKHLIPPRMFSFQIFALKIGNRISELNGISSTLSNITLVATKGKYAGTR